jgi:hypothetical protein
MNDFLIIMYIGVPVLNQEIDSYQIHEDDHAWALSWSVCRFSSMSLQNKYAIPSIF